MKKPYLLPSVILMLAALAFCAWLYPELPQRIPMHWNAQGEVDGYAPRGAIFAYSAVIAVLVAVWRYALPALSPKRFPVEDFLPTYGYTCLAVVACSPTSSACRPGPRTAATWPSTACC